MQPAKFAFICLACFGGGIVALRRDARSDVVGTHPRVVLAGLADRMDDGQTQNDGWPSSAGRCPKHLELLGRSLRAGHSLNAGFGLVASEMEAPLATEFGRAFEEQNFGIPLDEAIEDMAQRVPNMDLRFFATAVVSAAANRW